MPSRPFAMLFGAALFGFVAGSCGPKEQGEACSEGECMRGYVCNNGTCSRCADTPECREKGLCSDYLGKCVATDGACAQSTGCKTDGRCALLNSECGTYDDAERERRRANAEEWRRRNPNADNKEGGCPCGCDRSEELLAELEAGEVPASLRIARQSLRVIAEREHAGYVTEAMVSHRLRLRAFEEDHSPDGFAEFSATGLAQAVRHARSNVPLATKDGLRVRSDLVVFGRVVETVNGREKELEPCFRLWLELQNSSEAPIALARPELDGSVRFDVRRWYLEGTDGMPWDGVVPAGETRSVFLIGYVADALDPGPRVEAHFTIGTVRLTEAAVALGRWDALLEPHDSSSQ